MDLNEVLIFAHVVRAGSFTAAARELAMPKSTASRKVSELEARLGARLLQRTTRRLRLTDVGRAFYQHAERVLSELEAAEHAVTRMQEVPRGLLRVTAPLNFGFLGPIVASFLQRHAEVEVELVATDRLVDLVEEGFDVAVRAGRLADSTLIARTLGSLRSFVVASPAFLERHDPPTEPADLGRLDALVFGARTASHAWRLSQGARTVSVDVRVRLSVNDFDTLEEAARAGLGVALLPAYRVVQPLREGLLRRVLPDWHSADTPIQAVYPSTRHLAPKVGAFLDHLKDRMTPPPWEIGPLP